MKNTPDEIIEIVSAFKAGKAIECRDIYAKHGGEPWLRVDPPNWNFGVNRYRVAPEPKLRPWKPEEVPVGALVRVPGNQNCKSRSIITHVNHSTVHYGEWCEHIPKFTGPHFEHSTDGGKTWKPCGVEE